MTTLRNRRITLILMLLISLSLLTPFALGQERERGMSTRSRTTDPAAARNVERWAVLIGVSRYKFGDENLGGNRIPNLKNAADDAQALYDFLRTDELGGFRDVKEGGHMILLKDEDANRVNVERALATLKQSKPDDYFVIYIAAHGALVPESDAKTRATEEVPYFALHDSDLRDMKNTALRMDAFRKLVSEVPAKKGLVLSDTCHSAGVQLAGRGLITTTRANSRYLEEMNQVTSGVGFISAADQTELSYELDNINHGVFTWCLLEGLRGNADRDNDGQVDFKELKDYLRDTVPELTNNRQHPQYNTTTIEANRNPLAVVPYLEGAKPV
ncbi:MAG TPA: caspase family protein, partial [Blastocatellia bacterium]|nr:caspase family protein [Blastocatellia bacterium]